MSVPTTTRFFAVAFSLVSAAGGEMIGTAGVAHAQPASDEVTHCNTITC